MFTAIVVDDEYWALYGVINTFDWQHYGFRVIHQTCDALDAWDKIQKMKPDVFSKQGFSTSIYSNWNKNTLSKKDISGTIYTLDMAREMFQYPMKWRL